jgi:transcriptional regulator with XRE-family HTH domain
MPKPSPYPNHPIRVLRSLLGFPSAERFAAFVGVPAETIRNAEQGRQSVTPRLAKLIAAATDVSAAWLMGGTEAKGPPVTIFGEPLTKEAFEKYSGPQARLKCDPNSPEWANYIEETCAFAATLLRAAARRGRLPQCRHLLHAGLDEAAEHLDIPQLWKSERTDELNARFHSRVKFGDDSELEFGDYHEASGLLSQTALFRWDKVLAGNERDREWFLEEIDKLRDVVEASFSVVPLKSRRRAPAKP